MYDIIITITNEFDVYMPLKQEIKIGKISDNKLLIAFIMQSFINYTANEAP